MTHKSIVMLAVLALAALPACDRDRDRTGSTTTTGAGTEGRSPRVEDVRVVLLAERPDAIEAIKALQITNVDGVVTLRGHVNDEQARTVLVERVRRMPNVKLVKDELFVMPTGPKMKMEGAPQDQPGNAPPSP